MAVRNPDDLASDARLDDLLGRLPPQLYKYSGLSAQKLEWMRSLVVGSNLYFPSPSSFNDPLDCRVPPRYEASALTIEQYWRQAAKRNFPSQPARDHKKTIRRLIRESKTSAGQSRLTQVLFDSLDRNGTACLTTDPTSMLMWSYYAEGHSGVAVRFDTSPEWLAQIPKPCIPIEVQYRSTFPEINYYRSTTLEFLTTVLGTKATAWAHEYEWRLVLVGRSGHVQMPPPMISGIILGMRIKADVESEIRSWVRRRTPSVELLRVVHKPYSFELQVVSA